MPSALRTLVVEVSPARFMEVITGFQDYPRFLPEIEETSVESVGRGAWRVGFVLRVIRRLDYTLMLTRQGDEGLSWTQENGVFKRNDGSWKLRDLGDGRTEVTYAIDITLGVYMPRALVNTLVGEQLPATLERFKACAEGRQVAALLGGGAEGG